MEVELQSIYHGCMDPNQDWDPDNAHFHQGGALAVVFVVSGLNPQHPKPNTQNPSLMKVSFD